MWEATGEVVGYCGVIGRGGGAVGYVIGHMCSFEIRVGEEGGTLGGGTMGVEC